MDEEQLAPSESAPAGAAATTLAPEPNEQAISSEPLDLGQLQDMTPAALQELFVRFDLRLHPGRTRHQSIVDLIRHVLPRGQQVRTSGWLEQPNDGPPVLRSPRLNFLPLPEDVGVSHQLIRQFSLRPGQVLAGTIRLPREREKGLMLDRVLSIEGQPAEEWQAPTAFDNLTRLSRRRIMLENNSLTPSRGAVDLLDSTVAAARIDRRSATGRENDFA
jgi:transcription termination factor Rho